MWPPCAKGSVERKMVYVGIKVRIPLLIDSPLISPWYVTIVDEGNLKYFPQKDRKSETYDLAWSSFRGENQWWPQPRSQGSLLPALRNEVALASRNVGCFFRLVGGKKLVMPLPIIMQQQRINHCPFGMYGTIIHPLILFTSGWCPTTHFGC